MHKFNSIINLFIILKIEICVFSSKNYLTITLFPYYQSLQVNSPLSWDLFTDNDGAQTKATKTVSEGIVTEGENGSAKWGVLGFRKGVNVL